MKTWEDLTKICENREKQRAYYIPENKGAYQSLNGTWNFTFYPEGENKDGRSGLIPVPSCWQMHGYEKPYYTNAVFPFPVDPPYVPDSNPVGVYERSFELENDGLYYMVFEGVSSRLELFINGQYVGCSQGSHLQSEFNISKYVKAGENTVMAKVYKWCTGSYLEDQDQFRHNGIFRDVYILQRPEGHIKDIDIVTDDNKIIVDFEGNGNVSLFDGDILLDKKESDGSCVFEVAEPVLWNSEKPYLYRLVFESKGEIITQKIGFVKYEMGEKGEFLVNGKSVKIKGINHHDTNPVTGWYMTDEDMLRDLQLMKKLNINTIRTSHYPPHPKFVDMCDELGFYVMLENDMEMHGFTTRNVGGMVYDSLDNSEWISNLPEWEETFMERIERTYERDKNHTCIFSWSIGNESAIGKHQLNMIKWLKSNDKRRFVHSEDASRMYDEKLLEKDILAEDMPDIHSRMYPSPEYLEEYANDKNRKIPVFMCEYVHAMGNGPGSIREYWDVVEKYPNVWGGCIWEWADHAVKTDSGLLYGGDFGELTHDRNFCFDGLVMTDRSFKSGTLNAAAVYRNIKCELKGNILTLTNGFSFTNLNEFSFICSVEADGLNLWKSEDVYDLSPGESTEIELELPEECGLGAHVNCRLVNSENEVIESVQLETGAISRPVRTGNSVILDDNDVIEISGAGFRYIFSKEKGTIVSFEKNGEEQFVKPPVLSVWRAPIDNENVIKKKWAWHEPYQSENLDRVFTKIYGCDVNENKITVSASLAGVGRTPFFRYETVYEFFDDGKVKITLDGKIKDGFVWLPRLGFEFFVPDKSFTYYGRGPVENYCDMCEHAEIGFYESTAVDEYVDYPMPQEHGNHTNVRRVCFYGGIKIKTDSHFEFSASKYDSMKLYKAQHTFELEENDWVTVRIDYKNSGVGTNACGPELHEKYRLNDKEIFFEFYLQ